MTDNLSSSGEFILDQELLERPRRQWISSPILSSALFLWVLTTSAIIIVLLRGPTDLQCTRQLNMYCK
jgi:hypothetical protein